MLVTELGAKADPMKDKIEVDGKKVIAEDLVYVLLHKDRGVVSTLSDPEGRPTVAEPLSEVRSAGGKTVRMYPVGRLDFATSGALLATNDGAFADALLHPREGVPKTYVVKVSGVMSDADLAKWTNGVMLEDGMTLPAKVALLRHEEGKTWLELTIREGRNQQIRRMGEATGVSRHAPRAHLVRRGNDRAIAAGTMAHADAGRADRPEEDVRSAAPHAGGGAAGGRERAGRRRRWTRAQGAKRADQRSGSSSRRGDREQPAHRTERVEAARCGRRDRDGQAGSCAREEHARAGRARWTSVASRSG